MKQNEIRLRQLVETNSGSLLTHIDEQLRFEVKIYHNLKFG